MKYSEPENNFVPISHNVIGSPIWRSLSNSARLLYIELCRRRNRFVRGESVEVGSKVLLRGTFWAMDAGEDGIIAVTGLCKRGLINARRDLVACGLITVTKGHKGMASTYAVHNEIKDRVQKKLPNISKLGAQKATPLGAKKATPNKKDNKSTSEINSANSGTASPRRISFSDDPDLAFNEAREAIRVNLAARQVRGQRRQVDAAARLFLREGMSVAPDLIDEVMNRIPADKITQYGLTQAVGCALKILEGATA